MPDVDELLAKSKAIASKAGLGVLDGVGRGLKRYTHCTDLPKEIKAKADEVLNRDILQSLAPLGIPVFSEESGYLQSGNSSDYWFIVDPLDGTYNFVKGLGPSAVSIALWRQQTPIFGVIYSLSDRQLFWGGAGIGAFVDGRPITVSGTSDRATASICTGFPVRFDLEDTQAMQGFWQTIQPFAKVRMIGSAAMSLMHVARGSADVYFEQSIMLWDVAAGLAIVQGAGGSACFTSTSTEHSLNVFASNGQIAQYFR